MQAGLLEHVNITVSDSQKTADMLCKLFGWKVRWSGPSISGGTSFHVGTEHRYLAVFSLPTPEDLQPTNHKQIGMNHIGIVVDDIDATETRVVSAGFTPGSHDDYEPGKRFYFYDDDDIEYEVVSYN